jgi:co-chaperonin GroES (HSP10)
MKLLYSKILVEVIEPEEKIGSLYMPDQYKQQKTGMLGKVISTGDGTMIEKFVLDKESGEVVRTFVHRPINSSIKSGVTIIFPRYVGQEANIGDDKKYLFINELDVLGVVEEN